MFRKRVSGVLLIAVFSFLLFSQAYGSEAELPKSVLGQLKTSYPSVKFYNDDNRLTRIYGGTFGSGSGYVETAEGFVADYSGAFGVSLENLKPQSLLADGRHSQQLMYNKNTGEYKFTLVYYTQYIDDIPVYMADLRLLIRNEADYPLVLASSALRNIGDFSPNTNVIADRGLAKSAALNFDSELKNISEPRLVIWAGIDDMKVDPALTMEIVADNGLQATTNYKKWRLLVDAQSGEVLYSENMIIGVDVTGNVSGNATEGDGADICGPESSTPMPYARVSISGGNTAYADINGDFTIPHGGSSPVTVNSNLWGQWFRVYNQSGGDAQLSQSVTPPGPANFLHNSANTSEYNRSEVNSYLHANVVRDYTLTYNPSFPVIPNQTNFTVNVNIGDNCNAYYDGSSINFYSSGGGCPNTGFSTVVHHEYGHHLVQVAGSGQGQYGEGMGDVMGVLIMDDPDLGIGFLGNCNSGIRSANNNHQYPCSGEIHDCGMLISGCVWDTRNALLLSNPSTYRDIISNLAINAMLLHTGSEITPGITIDYLTLDDDDNDLGNGTPHYDEITAGFGAHNMWAGPPPANDICAEAVEVCPGVYSGSTSNTTNDGSSNCVDSNGSPDLWYKYTPAANGTLTVSGCSGTTYDMMLSLHTGCPGNAGNDIACDDDGCGTVGGPSIISASVTAGITYYIRVTGWNGAAGGYTINITGPECGQAALLVYLPNGAPEFMPPGQPASFPVTIDNAAENYVPGTGIMHYRYDGGSYLTSPLSFQSGNLYEATLPATDCNGVPEYYISAEGDGGTVVTSPYNAPETVHMSITGILVFEDNFQTNQGWTVENSGGLTDGPWDRGIPVNCDRGDPVTDHDGSGMCYLTDNSSADGCNSDVDGGYTYLLSPTLDLSAGNAWVKYSLWYTNFAGADPNNDLFKVWISSNNGSTWNLVQTFGPVTYSGWTEYVFKVDDFVTPTDQTKIRFEASDLNASSVVEAGIDAVFIYACVFEGGDCGYYVVGDYNGNESFNVADVIAAFSRLQTGSPEAALLCECPPGGGNVWAVAMDLNNNCVFNIADVIAGFSKLQTGSPELLPCDQCPPGSPSPRNREDQSLSVPNLKAKSQISVIKDSN